jgi:hypothetical protein
MIITKSWLQANRTKRGGWTKAQADILGLEYPLTKGWMGRIINHELSEVDRLRFELAADTTALNKVSKAMNAISRLSSNEREIVKSWINN